VRPVALPLTGAPPVHRACLLTAGWATEYSFDGRTSAGAQLRRAARGRLRACAAAALLHRRARSLAGLHRAPTGAVAGVRGPVPLPLPPSDGNGCSRARDALLRLGAVACGPAPCDGGGCFRACNALRRRLAWLLASLRRPPTGCRSRACALRPWRVGHSLAPPSTGGAASLRVQAVVFCYPATLLVPAARRAAAEHTLL